MALAHWVQLALTEGIGPILTARIVEAAGSAEGACGAGPGLLGEVEGIGRVKGEKIWGAIRKAGELVEAELERAAAAGISAVCLEDEGYPALLKCIEDAPPVLWMRGSLEARDLNAVAIVGSRRCSHYGREQGERFAGLLAQAGMTVVSGGARGVDSAAHRGAMALPEGRTIAVLGCGVDVAYPPENAGLFGQIAGRGAVVSEFPMGTPPAKENFPRRNRIISGMSRGVLVVEADVASGALITARLACDAHNRPVFAIPGKIDNPMSAGPHALIRDGAVLVMGMEDIVGGLGPLPEGVREGGEERVERGAALTLALSRITGRCLTEHFLAVPLGTKTFRWAVILYAGFDAQFYELGAKLYRLLPIMIFPPRMYGFFLKRRMKLLSALPMHFRITCSFSHPGILPPAHEKTARRRLEVCTDR